ncbi:hypothetical protein MHYP_G00176520 [Metynnis hypsauchen]
MFRDAYIMPTALIQNAQSNLLCNMSQERHIVRVNKRSFNHGHGSIVRAVGGHAVIRGGLPAGPPPERCPSQEPPVYQCISLTVAA